MVSLTENCTLLPMQPEKDSRNRGHQIMVPSPRCILNCQALSIHLPPLRDPGDTSARSKYMTPPMSASPAQSQFGDAHQKRHKDHREQTLSPTSAPPYSGKQSPESIRTGHSAQSRSLGQVPTSVASLGVRTSLHQSSTPHPAREASHDELSSINQESPELHHLTPGPPGVARRAKAHVPSACVNCKRKHLACETRRPCNRCVQTGKEVRDPKILLHLPQLLILSRLHALTSSTKNEADRDFEKKIASERWLSEANSLMQSFTLTEPVCFQSPSLVDVDPSLTESCAHSLKRLSAATGPEPRILAFLISSNHRVQQDFLFRLPLLIYPRAFLPFSLRRNLWLHSIIMRLLMCCLCHTPRKDRLWRTLSFHPRGRRFRGCRQF